MPYQGSDSARSRFHWVSEAKSGQSVRNRQDLAEQADQILNTTRRKPIGYDATIASTSTSAPLSTEIPMTDHAQLMDRVYRSQRHIYDLTRRYFLLGRDTLIERMEIRERNRILEIGCGTARNLIFLACRYPSVQLFGIDASSEMLKTARINVARAGIGQRVQLEYCLAEEFSPVSVFGSTERFDTVFFSYSLSMIPEWRSALDRGLLNLRPGHSLWVVDFWDQRGLPTWFANILERWLSVFHVHHRPEILEYVGDLEKSGLISLSIEPLYRRYAYLARLTKIT